MEPQLLPDRAMLCLLVSAVTAGNGAHDVEQSSGDRSQVRRMLKLAVNMLWTTHTEAQAMRASLLFPSVASSI